MRSKGNKIPYFSFGFKKINNTYWAPTYGHLGNLYTSSGASYGANPEIISTSAIYIISTPLLLHMYMKKHMLLYLFEIRFRVVKLYPLVIGFMYFLDIIGRNIIRVRPIGLTLIN